jgi:hypothetical protein
MVTTYLGGGRGGRVENFAKYKMVRFTHHFTLPMHSSVRIIFLLFQLLIVDVENLD